jgi:hypothetical protein
MPGRAFMLVYTVLRTWSNTTAEVTIPTTAQSAELEHDAVNRSRFLDLNVLRILAHHTSLAMLQKIPVLRLM